MVTSPVYGVGIESDWRDAMKTEPNFNEASHAYEAYVMESNTGVDRAGVLHEATCDTIRMNVAAQKLKFAVETYLSDLAGCYHVGGTNSDANELCRLIIDYDQDEIGHEASDVLRAALV